MKTKHLIGIIVSILIIVASFMLPETSFMSQLGLRTCGVVIAFLIMLIFECLPMCVTCLIFLALLPVLGITANFNGALTGFANQVVIFIFASFGIAAGFTEIPLTKRILIVLLKKFGKSVKTMMLSMMAVGAVLSSIVSNVPTCAIFMAIGLSFLEVFEDQDAKKRTGRALMISIAISSMIGGMMTPAGSSLNLLAISLLEQYTGISVTFVQWMAIGIPLTIVLIPLAWVITCFVFKPAELKPGMVEEFIAGLDVPEKITVPEIKVLVITAIMLVFWIASSWVPAINVMVVACLGCAALFLPGINVLNWDKFIKTVAWDSVVLVAATLSLAAAMINNGVSDFVTSLLPSAAMSLPMMVGFTALFIFVLLIFIPSAPALISLLSLPLISMATSMGHGPAVATMVLALCAANCYLLPLDAVPLLTYSTGYYKMSDQPKVAAPLQICIVIIMMIWLPIITRILGLA